MSSEYEPDLRQLDVTWTAADDAALSDGSPGSGVASYAFQYRLGDGSWSSMATTDFRGFSIPDVDAGGEAEVKIIAVDRAGNRSPDAARTLTAQVPATWQCAEQELGAYPSRCVAGLNAPADSTDGDANVTLEPEESTEAAGTARAAASSPNGRYRVRVRTSLGDQWSDPLDRWSTIRSAPNAWVIGQAPDGALIDAEYVSQGVASGGKTVYWYLGALAGFAGGPSDNCGYVLSRNLAPSGVGDFGTCGGMRFTKPIQVFSSKTNCPNDDDDDGKRKCDHGTAVFLENDTRICANVALTPTGGSTPCSLDGPNYKGQLQAGSCFEWRYITNDGGRKQDQFVLGKLRSRPNPEASWVFIRRTALNPNNSQLPTIRTRRDQSCDTGQ